MKTNLKGDVLIMVKLHVDKYEEMQLNDELKRLDDDMREVGEIRKEMDKMLYDIEKRIAKLRRPRRG